MLGRLVEFVPQHLSEARDVGTRRRAACNLESNCNLALHGHTRLPQESCTGCKDF